VTILFLRGSLAPLGVTVSFLWAAAAYELDRVNWRKSLEQQLEISEEGVPRPATP
jgi:hypothetical protein